LAWQPIPNQSQLDNAERLLASSGDDGIISLWNVRSEGKAKFSMTMDSSVVALAFTPDGAFLAGVTSHQILIWRLEDVSVPRARWVRGPEPGWLSPKANGSVMEEDQHCLSWDAPGQKLAYGVNSQVSFAPNALLV
jgi:transducin (beta)-like 1